MQIFVRSNATFILRVDEETNLAEVRDLISEHEDIPTAELRLYSEGSPLDDESFPVTSLNTPVIDVIVALKGGKVHGSLSRAGKVKGQTPKVEKTEKPKKKTGRAKRRKQYNQRFDKNGQVIKRKPNSNDNKTS